MEIKKSFNGYIPVLLLLAVMVVADCLEAAPVVWSGLDVSFTKENGVPATDPAAQDMITPNVIITRGNVRGIFNIAVETSFNAAVSPTDTEWAFPNNNAGKDIAATNWEDLQFDLWVDAFGGQNFPGPGGTVGEPAVVHLITDDIYLDITFTSWSEGAGGGGGFAYDRAANPIPDVDGDANGDGKVDAADLNILALSWQRSVTTGTGADFTGNGFVDAQDLNVLALNWQFGVDEPSLNSLNNVQTQSLAVVIPEPTTALSVMVLSGLVSTLRRR